MAANQIFDLCSVGTIVLKALNHLFGQFSNMSIYFTNKTYINLTKFEPLKPSRSGDISLLVLKIYKEAVKQPCLDQKIQCLFSKYSYFLRTL